MLHIISAILNILWFIFLAVMAVSMILFVLISYIETYGVLETRKAINSLTGKTYWWSELTVPIGEEEKKLPTVTMSFNGWKALYEIVDKRFMISDSEILYDKDEDGKPELKIILQDKAQAKQYRAWYKTREQAEYWARIEKKIEADERAEKEKEAADNATIMAFVEDMKSAVKAEAEANHAEVVAAQKKIHASRQAAIQRGMELRTQEIAAQMPLPR